MVEYPIVLVILVVRTRTSESYTGTGVIEIELAHLVAGDPSSFVVVWQEA